MNLLTETAKKEEDNKMLRVRRKERSRKKLEDSKCPQTFCKHGKEQGFCCPSLKFLKNPIPFWKQRLTPSLVEENEGSDKKAPKRPDH